MSYISYPSTLPCLSYDVLNVNVSNPYEVGTFNEKKVYKKYENIPFKTTLRLEELDIFKEFFNNTLKNGVFPFETPYFIIKFLGGYEVIQHTPYKFTVMGSVQLL